MTIAEKTLESAEINTFTLFKEGLFFKCYNEDAMVFAKHIKPYKVSSKYVKNMGADVLSLGFPVSETEKGKLAFDILSVKLGAVKFDAGSDKVIRPRMREMFPAAAARVGHCDALSLSMGVCRDAPRLVLHTPFAYRSLHPAYL